MGQDRYTAQHGGDDLDCRAVCIRAAAQPGHRTAHDDWNDDRHRLLTGPADNDLPGPVAQLEPGAHSDGAIGSVDGPRALSFPPGGCVGGSVPWPDVLALRHSSLAVSRKPRRIVLR